MFARYLYFWLSQSIRAYAYVQTYFLIIALRKDACSKDQERNQPWPILNFKIKSICALEKRKDNTRIMKKNLGCLLLIPDPPKTQEK